MTSRHRISRKAFLGMTAAVGGSILLPPGLASAAGEPRRAVRRGVEEQSQLVAYVGDFSTAITVARADQDTGELVATGSVSGIEDPSFLVLSPDGTRLYAVSDADTGRVTALAVAADGGLTVLGDQQTGGSMATHLALHPSGKYLVVANYGGGSTAVFPVQADGTLGAMTDLAQYTGSGPDPRQDASHAHMVAFLPGGGYLLVPDLGTDQIHVHTLDLGTGTLSSVGDIALPPGSGPRHLAFHPTASFFYLVAELNATVTVCSYDSAAGTVTPGQVVSADAGTTQSNAPAEVAVSADGRFVYVSNRGPNTVSRFTADAGGQQLTFVDEVPCGGNWPRHIAVSPSGTMLFASNQYSDTVTALKVDPATGALSSTGQSLSTPSPVCLLFGHPQT